MAAALRRLMVTQTCVRSWPAGQAGRSAKAFVGALSIALERLYTAVIAGQPVDLI